MKQSCIKAPLDALRKRELIAQRETPIPLIHRLPHKLEIRQATAGIGHEAGRLASMFSPVNQHFTLRTAGWGPVDYV